MSGGLRGTGLVADDLYLLAHADQSGRPLLQPRPLGIGLAGALLAELMLSGSITLWQSGVAVARGPWPDDELHRQVLGLLAGEAEPHPVREWLLFLARTAVGDVARRLEQAGYLTRAGSWVPWRSARWVPVDPDWAFAALLRVRSAVDPARPVAVYGAVLAGLAAGCGLGFRLDQYLPPASRSAEDAARWLDVSLRHLIAQVQAAVDSAVLAHRT
jgi:hypothetical protein